MIGEWNHHFFHAIQFPKTDLNDDHDDGETECEMVDTEHEYTLMILMMVYIQMYIMCIHHTPYESIDLHV